jgi:hypothetical protein
VGGVPDGTEIDVVGAFVIAGRVPDAPLEPDFELRQPLSTQAVASATTAGLRARPSRGLRTG